MQFSAIRSGCIFTKAPRRLLVLTAYLHDRAGRRGLKNIDNLHANMQKHLLFSPPETFGTSHHRTRQADSLLTETAWLEELGLPTHTCPLSLMFDLHKHRAQMAEKSRRIPNILLQPTSVDFIHGRLPAFHPAFEGFESLQYDHTSNRFVSTEPDMPSTQKSKAEPLADQKSTVPVRQLVPAVSAMEF